MDKTFLFILVTGLIALSLATPVEKANGKKEVPVKKLPQTAARSKETNTTIKSKPTEAQKPEEYLNVAAQTNKANSVNNTESSEEDDGDYGTEQQDQPIYSQGGFAGGSPFAGGQQQFSPASRFNPQGQFAVGQQQFQQDPQGQLQFQQDPQGQLQFQQDPQLSQFQQGQQFAGVNPNQGFQVIPTSTGSFQGATPSVGRFQGSTQSLGNFQGSAPTSGGRFSGATQGLSGFQGATPSGFEGTTSGVNGFDGTTSTEFDGASPNVGRFEGSQLNSIQGQLSRQSLSPSAQGVQGSGVGLVNLPGGQFTGPTSAGFPIVSSNGGRGDGNSQFSGRQVLSSQGQPGNRDYVPSAELDGFSEDADQDGFVDAFPGNSRLSQNTEKSDADGRKTTDDDGRLNSIAQTPASQTAGLRIQNNPTLQGVRPGSPQFVAGSPQNRPFAIPQGQQLTPEQFQSLYTPINQFQGLSPATQGGRPIVSQQFNPQGQGFPTGAGGFPVQQQFSRPQNQFAGLFPGQGATNPTGQSGSFSPTGAQIQNGGAGQQQQQFDGPQFANIQNFLPGQGNPQFVGQQGGQFLQGQGNPQFIGGQPGAQFQGGQPGAAQFSGVQPGAQFQGGQQGAQFQGGQPGAQFQGGQPGAQGAQFPAQFSQGQGAQFPAQFSQGQGAQFSQGQGGAQFPQGQGVQFVPGQGSQFLQGQQGGQFLQGQGNPQFLQGQGGQFIQGNPQFQQFNPQSGAIQGGGFPGDFGFFPGATGPFGGQFAGQGFQGAQGQQGINPQLLGGQQGFTSSGGSPSATTEKSVKESKPTEKKN